MPHYPDDFEYSDKMKDDEYEYRHVIMPRDAAKKFYQITNIQHRKRGEEKMMEESEWRALGVQQSRGWEHYCVHRPEPHILLFRRKLGTDPETGEPMAYGLSS